MKASAFARGGEGPDPPARARFHVALAVLAAASLFLFVLLAIVVPGGRLTAIDEEVLRWLRDPVEPERLVGPAWVFGAMRDLSALGSASALSVAIVLALGTLALQGHLRAMWWLGATSWGGMLLGPALKELLSRARPTVVPHLVDVGSMSFPSGHALNSAVVYLTIAVALGAAVKRRPLRIYLVATAGLLSLAIGTTRIYLGVHYPTDVLAGWSAGVAWVLASLLLARGRDGREIGP